MFDRSCPMSREVVETLLEFNPDLSLEDIYQRNALYWARATERRDIERLLLQAMAEVSRHGVLTASPVSSYWPQAEDDYLTWLGRLTM